MQAMKVSMAKADVDDDDGGGDDDDDDSLVKHYIHVSEPDEQASSDTDGDQEGPCDAEDDGAVTQWLPKSSDLSVMGQRDRKSQVISGLTRATGKLASR